ncbi:hypothetical protein AVEN_254121-1 [Araneus ventricosus]|uniref:Uncharacterized protein n=1 Tax=Araneus ventricosus TaxID=182803 RepID=A0A4Y2BXW2_ARAVE|nr:hypothetical protein AVEN_254121-1 [Araneus ventricosus]
MAEVTQWQGPGFGAGGLQARNPSPLKIRHVWGWLHIKSYVVFKRPPAGVARKVGEGMPAQVPASSNDRGSNYTVQPKIALVLLHKRDINITNPAHF